MASDQFPPPARIVAVLTGEVALLGGRPSAIAKTPRTGPVFLGRTGLTGDSWADSGLHGGTEKALHHYPQDHYRGWHARHPPSAALPCPGAFGENVSTLDMTEDNVCIGDVFRLGGSVVQVSQPRQPCWKLNLRFDHTEFARWVQELGWTGWYYRVIEEGEVAMGDRFHLLGRDAPDWPLSRLLKVWFQTPLDHAQLETIAGMDCLSDRWRAAARRRLETGAVEDWNARLKTPPLVS